MGQTEERLDQAMYDQPWLSWKKIHAYVKERWFKKCVYEITLCGAFLTLYLWSIKYTWPESDNAAIKKALDYKVGRRLQQLLKDNHIRDGVDSRITWTCPTVKKFVLNKFEADRGFKWRQRVTKANRESARGGSLHIG
ncbi:hypothetical protein PIB30_030523 [Stylosanthes scabra]|uniref:Transmembrane protein n=1 Tax=Stylosanthes scabra TaxID=79078 RepID=A0ABU6Y8Y2_9FABA|nr:hypothetical protein [Stylosanthes scabra]